jgi:hypothetical protein
MNLRISRWRIHYWSNGPVSKWLYSRVGVKKPPHETLEGWDVWETTTKNDHPIVYWVVETLLDKIQDIVMFPMDVLNAIRIYYRYRFIYKSHKVETKLAKGEYHAADELILQSIFTILVNFVEVELAGRWIISLDEPKPWFRRHKLLNWFEFRSRDAGIKYLEWEMSLSDPEHQAIRAKTVFELYNWWTVTRPNRPDPFVASGCEALYNEPRISNQSLCSPAPEGARECWKKQAEIEAQYYTEDTEKLIQLINFRHELWT